MLFTTPEQLIVLAIVLVGGWLLGYASAPSARKWKRRVREQSDSFTAYYGDAEEKLRASHQHGAELTAQVEALRAQQADAERTIAEMHAAAAAPVEAPRPTAITDAVFEPVAAIPAANRGEPEAEALVAPADEPASVEHLRIPVPEAVSETSAEFVVERTPPHWAGESTRAAIQPEEAAEAAAPEGGLAAARDTFPRGQDAAAPAADTAPPSPHAIAAATAELSTPPVAAAEAIAPMSPAPATAAPAPIGPAEPEMPSKGWFASSARDDLTRIRGIDDLLNTRLFGLGVTRFEDIEKLSAEDEMALEQRLAMPVGYVGREQWRTQAALLRAGRHEEHAGHFGAVEA